MKPSDLIECARFLALADDRRPKAVNLRRAQSSAYYALFHCLAKCCADMLIGKTPARRSQKAWLQVYRGLSHKSAKDACKKIKTVDPVFPRPIEDFASQFMDLQNKRHKADYDPSWAIFRSTVVSDIDRAEVAITNFAQCKALDRRAFAAFVLFNLRRDDAPSAHAARFSGR